MGARFRTLPPSLQAMHDVLADGGATGKATVIRGRNFFARVIAWLFEFPPEGEHEVHVSFQERDGVETWTRDFGGSVFRSSLSQRSAYLVERFGPLRFVFDLLGEADGLSMSLRRWWVGPVPLPRSWAPRSPAREWEVDGTFWFDVPISAPLIGLIMQYKGWLVQC